jgi:hypothetical protein
MQNLTKLIAGVGALFAVSESARAGIPVANWAIPYLIGSAVTMFFLMGVVSVFKPKDVVFKDITMDNSPPIAVGFRSVSFAVGVVFTGILAWAVFDSVMSGYV